MYARSAESKVKHLACAHKADSDSCLLQCHPYYLCAKNTHIDFFIKTLPFLLSESQKKKSNNQDDSDDDDDDDEAGPSVQQVAAVQPQAGYVSPMTQPGMPPVAGAPGMPPAGYQGKAETIFSVNFKFVSVKFNMFYAFVLDQMFKIMC